MENRENQVAKEAFWLEPRIFDIDSKKALEN